MKFLGKFLDFRFVSRFVIWHKTQPGVKETSGIGTAGDVLLRLYVAVVFMLAGVNDVFPETLEANFCSFADFVSLFDRHGLEHWAPNDTEANMVFKYATFTSFFKFLADSTVVMMSWLLPKISVSRSVAVFAVSTRMRIARRFLVIFLCFLATFS